MKHLGKFSWALWLPLLAWAGAFALTRTDTVTVQEP